MVILHTWYVLRQELVQDLLRLLEVSEFSESFAFSEESFTVQRVLGKSLWWMTKRSSELCSR